MSPVTSPPPGRAGRNLPAAIVVGLALGAAALASLYAEKPVFLGIVVVAIVMGLWELTQALSAAHHNAPFVPLAFGGVATLCLAYVSGREAMVVATLLTGVATVIVRLPEGPAGVLSDLAASLFALLYVPFLAGFAVLLMVPADGADRVTTFLAAVVCSDVGGYAAGVLVGRHPMAPKISPKKSWEGLAGSVLTCVVGGSLLVSLLLHGQVWQGALYGAAIAAAATLGDLGESMLKRDIGIKDMGSLLPGHGGVMDRLDSLLPSAPVAYLLLSVLVPKAH
ncbi:MAG: phosphatidate cytidylyltransferase [Mycobacteriales bacterium]